MVPFVVWGVELGDVAWEAVVPQLVSRGWVLLKDVAETHFLQASEHSAPGPWTSVPSTEGSAGVRQAGLACHSAVNDAAEPVGALAAAICRGIDSAGVPDLAPLPAFNHANWCRAKGGQNFITPHRDPVTAGGVIAVLTIRGRAMFRVWDFDGSLADAQRHSELATEWETDDGDLVLMQGGGWPFPTSRCPIHEALSPRDGDRVTLTLRHNKGGYGADYFAPGAEPRPAPY
jgi:hypothetical protein